MSRFNLLSIASMSNTPILDINAAWPMVPLTIGLTLVVIFALERLIFEYPLRRGASAAIVDRTARRHRLRRKHRSFAASEQRRRAGRDAAGLPDRRSCWDFRVSFAMLLGSVMFLLISGVAPLIAAAQNTFDGTSNFILLTLPFFIWAGLIMEKGGISLRLVRFAMTLVWPHARRPAASGGADDLHDLRHLRVKIADVVAVGSVLRRELKEQGYKPEQGAAVLASSAAMSETIPPSLAMLVLGSVAPISIGTLFIAGLLPAAVIATLLMVLNYVTLTQQQRRVDPRATMPELLRASGGAILPPVMPVIMVDGIRFGIATPTEVSAVALLYGLVLAYVIYRAVDLKTLYTIAGQILPAGRHGALHHRCRVLVRLDAHRSQPACESGRDPALARRQSHRLHSWLNRSSDRGRLAAGRLARADHPGAAVDADRDAVWHRHHPLQHIMILAMGVGIFIPPIRIGFYVSCSVSESRLEATTKAIQPDFAVPWADRRSGRRLRAVVHPRRSPSSCRRAADWRRAGRGRQDCRDRAEARPAEGAEVVDCTGHFVLPGLINAHMHTWQTALRSVAANWTLLEYFRHVHAGLATVFTPTTSTSPPWPAR